MASGELRRAVEALVREWAAGRIVAPVSPSATQQWVDGQLRQHETRGLRPHPRGRLYGGRIRTIRAGRPLTGAETEAPDLTALRIEPGLLAWPAGEPSTPLAIHTTTALDAWLAGPGVAIPGSDPVRYTHLVGTVAWVDGVGLVWADDAPAPVDGAYPSSHYVSAATLARVLEADPPPWRVAHSAGAYTGGARRLAEACLASGRLLADRLPAGLTTQPGELGVIVPPDLSGVWAVAIGSDGALAVRLGLGAVGAAMLAWIAADTLSGTALSLAWLHVLADLQPLAEPGEDDTVYLVSEQDMADAYDGGGHVWMAGWVWPSDLDDGRAAVVVQRDAEISGHAVWESRVLALAINWTDGQPSGTLTAGDWCAWRDRPAYHILWRGTARTGEAARISLGNPYPEALSASLPASAPLVCQYLPGAGGALETERYWRADVSVITADSPAVQNAALNNCAGGGGALVSVSGAMYVYSGGPGVSAPDSLTVGGGSWTRKDWTSTPGSFDEPGSYPVSWSTVGFEWAKTAGCTDIQPDASWSSGGGKWTLPSGWAGSGWGVCERTAAGVATQDDVSLSGAGGGHAWLYLSDCPDASWAASWESGASRTTRARRWEADLADAVRIDAWGLDPSPPPYGTWTRLYAGLGEALKGKSWGGSVTCTGAYVVCQGRSPVSDVSTSDTDYQRGIAIARLGGVAVASSADLAPWVDLTTAAESPVTVGVSALVSAIGTRLWVPYPGGAWDADAGTPTPAGPQSWAGA